ncbi:hypothetical protein M404DRAFT_36293 [Pisolithus tinctorius Marx 270]|uniref:Uncharacterized protein n=1 Tax=Pisolithus tinctorius Marx 270 TaxID=870435 RepID=A0A0C3MWA6_PISTI|nr:hypothetical protein M404DRAFT_36293 [Pisolithus tinctorius Marx 270]
MESAFPLFRFAKNGWKLDYLASNSYLAWWKTHLDSEGNWKMKKSQDCEDDDKDMEMDKKDKKWKLLEANVKSETPDKRMKEGAASMVLPSPPVSNTSHLPSVAEETTYTNKKEIVPCTPQPEPEPVTVVPTKISVNPLACLAIAANKAQESLPKLPSDLNGSKIENEGLAIPSTTTKSAKGNVKVPGRMRPSPTKNGQNLCALQWLKRIQPNGTMEDFQKYYNLLSADKVKVSSTSSNCPHH